MSSSTNDEYSWVGFGRNYFHALGYTSIENDQYKQLRLQKEIENQILKSHGNDNDVNEKKEGLDSNNGNSINNPSKKNSAGSSYYTYNTACNEKETITCSSSASLFIAKDGHYIKGIGTMHGHVWGAKMNDNTTILPPISITIPFALPVVEIAAGRHFVLGKLKDGLGVISWGAGHFGQLGIVSSNSSAATNSTCSTNSTSNNTDDFDSAIPSFVYQPQIIERLMPKYTGSTIKSIAAGDWHSTALTESGRVWSWGCNRNGQCGKKPSREMITSTASACIQRLPLPVDKFGDTINNTTSGSDLFFTKITCGKSHTVALAQISTTANNPTTTNNNTASTNTKIGVVYCWGLSQYGQCGAIITPNTRKAICNGVIPPKRIDLQNCNVIDIAAGDQHTLALTQGGRVFSWGCNFEGQLGILPPQQQQQVTADNNGNDSNGSINSNDANNPPLFSLSSSTTLSCSPKPKLITDLDFVAIAAEREWKLRRQSSNNDERKEQVESNSGNNDNADHSTQQQQHILASVPTIKSIYASGNYSVALDSSGYVYGWGCNDTGVLGIPIPTASPSPTNKNGNGQHYPENTFQLPSVVLPPHPCSMDVQTFDSTHNVLIPQRISALNHLFIKSISCGPCHSWFHGNERDEFIKLKNRNSQLLKERNMQTKNKSQQQQQQQQQTTPATGDNNATPPISPAGRESHPQQQLQNDVAGNNANMNNITNNGTARNAPSNNNNNNSTIPTPTQSPTLSCLSSTPSSSSLKENSCSTNNRIKPTATNDTNNTPSNPSRIVSPPPFPRGEEEKMEVEIIPSQDPDDVVSGDNGFGGDRGRPPSNNFKRAFSIPSNMMKKLGGGSKGSNNSNSNISHNDNNDNDDDIHNSLQQRRRRSFPFSYFSKRGSFHNNGNNA